MLSIIATAIIILFIFMFLSFLVFYGFRRISL